MVANNVKILQIYVSLMVQVVVIVVQKLAKRTVFAPVAGHIMVQIAR